MKNCDCEKRRYFLRRSKSCCGLRTRRVRPVIVIQNNVSNKYSPTIIIAAITSQINKARLPTHVEITAPHFGLPKDSVVLLEQIRTIDKKRLREKIGRFNDDMMEQIDEGLKISLGFNNQ